MKYEVRVAGPDDVHLFDDELEAHRFANNINKTYLADHLAHPDPTDDVLCVATVNDISASVTINPAAAWPFPNRATE